ncbi:hypothetical protein [Pseudomonas juntendi]|uniref:hypothetical protein n=1 Tax=Pseudomonas juntendi TaxID=2666183 RepID=UPI0036F2D65E
MSRLAEFRKLEQTLAAQLAELEAMKGSSELQAEIEFETKLRDLLNKYGYSLRDIIVRDPSSPHSKRPPDARCCAPDFFLEPASHDATRQQSRKGVPLSQARRLPKVHRRPHRAGRVGYQGRRVRPRTFRLPQ